MSEHELEARIDDLYVELHCFEEKYEKLEAENQRLLELLNNQLWILDRLDLLSKEARAALEGNAQPDVKHDKSR